MKLDYTLAPSEFEDVIKVLQVSAETGKYPRDGWLEGKQFDKEKSLASIKRHLREYRDGKLVDDESGLHPLLHAACRCLMQYTIDSRNSPRSMDGHVSPFTKEFNLKKKKERQEYIEALDNSITEEELRKLKELQHNYRPAHAAYKYCTGDSNENKS